MIQHMSPRIIILLKSLWVGIKVFTLCVGSVFLAIALLFGGCYVNSTLTEKRLLREGQPIVKAIEAFYAKQGRYPRLLSELNLPPSSVDSSWKYSSRDDGRFLLGAYIGMARISIEYNNEPENPDMTGWFRDPDSGPAYWIRLTPPKP
jgi:hypothetical protein